LKIWRTSLACAVLAAAFGCQQTAPAPVAPSAPAKEDPAPTAVLDRLYRDYVARQDQRDVAFLVEMDQKLRNLSFERQSRYLKPEYESLGLSPALFDSDFFYYSGKLLAEAHRIDPNSPDRRYTLWSIVESDTTAVVNSPAFAESYVQEFPSGPFITQAYFALAGFYDDLFKVIKLEETGDRIDYKYDCFQPYIKSAPLAEQARAAQEAGIRYYQKLQQLRPDDESIVANLARLREGKDYHSWSSCPD
jgi:hypothetical protein